MDTATQTTDKYIKLEEKINIARQQNYTIISAATGKVNPYESIRLEIADKYFNGSYDGETKHVLLDMFEQASEYLRQCLGL